MKDVETKVPLRSSSEICVFVTELSKKRLTWRVHGVSKSKGCKMLEWDTFSYFSSFRLFTLFAMPPGVSYDDNKWDSVQVCEQTGSPATTGHLQAGSLNGANVEIGQCFVIDAFLDNGSKTVFLAIPLRLIKIFSTSFYNALSLSIFSSSSIPEFIARLNVDKTRLAV